MKQKQQVRDWNAFYRITSTRPVHPLLKLALEFAPTPGIAYDMGAGAGVDVEYLLSLGWTVHAVDQEALALEFIGNRLADYPSLILERASFEELKVQKCQLIFGAASFPFCHPGNFREFWGRMRASLDEGGILCGTFFGPKDGWARREDMTIQTEESLLELFSGFDVLFFDELEEDRETAMGNMKHWQVYSFILKK